MKLAVIADTHLGFQYGSERGEDAFDNAADAFQKTVEARPDAILLLGDIFDHKVEKPEVLGRAIQLFQRLNKSIASDKIIAIYGTHETRHKDATNPVQLLAQARLLTLLHKSSIALEKDAQKVVVYGLSGVHDSFAKDELASWNPQPTPGTFNIMLIHQTFKEDIPQLDNIMTYADLPKGFDLFLSGHIHHQHESNVPSILYPGSTIRTQLSANTPNKLGFYILEINNNQLTKKEFITLDAPREFVHLKLDVSNNSPAEIIAALDNRLTNTINTKTFANKKPIIKIKLIGQLQKGFSASDLYLSTITKKFKEHCFLKIDKSKIESEHSKERLKFLADLGQKQESIESLGIDLLARRLKDTNVPKPKLAELFEQLADGNLDASEALLSAQKDASIGKSDSICADAVPASASPPQDSSNSKSASEASAKGASWQNTFTV